MAPLTDAELAALARLPFPEQRARIDMAIGAGDDATRLLATVAAFGDHEPFAVAVRRLALAGRLTEPAVAAALVDAFGSLPDTGFGRLLRGIDGAPIADDQVAALARCVGQAVRALPIERIAALCLLDRWLKNAAAIERDALTAAAVERCDGIDTVEGADTVDDPTILRLPGATSAALAGRPAWRERLRRFADRVLEVLEAAPKSISQANAEEILSRRVYTDPGHFFVELLQNAEDAEATEWHVGVGADAVTVWHDGVPFDAKDVVGVLSIGQTTKRRDQIGFFGVGFKSVYEVCERPQVYSGPFLFEIADVSIPRRLAARPADGPQDGTLLVLPLRSAGDPARSPDALWGHACSVPAETLLTLRHLRRLRVARGERSRTVAREAGSEPGRVHIANEEAGSTRAYLVESDRVRLAGAAVDAPVLVAIALDDAGAPTPHGGGPTVFNYLPTRERSGLRFLLHAHFDVPVDRERLDPESPRNRSALRWAGRLLARAARTLIDEADADPSDEAGALRLGRLLDVLPLPEELGHPAYGVVLEELRAGAADLALLPASGPGRLTPGAASVVDDDELARALGGVPLDASGRRLAVAPLPARARRVAAVLGAETFGARELVDLLERSTGSGGDSDATTTPAPWLSGALPAILDVLGRAEPDEPPPGGGAALVSPDLHLLPDQAGRLRPVRALARAEPDLRAVYGDDRPLLRADLDHRATPWQARLIDRLGVPTIGAAELVDDLASDAELATALASGDRAAPLLEYLERQPVELVADLAALALFRAEDGRVLPLVGPDSVWLAPTGALGELMRRIDGRPPLLAPELQARFGGFLERLGARTFDLEALLDAIDGALAPSDDELLALHRILEDDRASISPRLARRLARAAIFSDADGRRRPLLGDGAALLAADAEIRRLISDAPWVAPEIARLAYVAALGVTAVGPPAVVRVLLLEENLPIAPFADPGRLRAAYAYLVGRADAVPSDLARRLAAAPVWLARDGEPRRLDALRRRPVGATLAALYDAWDAFPLIDEGEGGSGDDDGGGGDASAFALATALRVERHLVAPDHATLVADLVDRAPDAAGASFRSLLVAALVEAAAELPARTLGELARAELWRDASGTPRPLAGWGEESSVDACGRALGPLREALAHGRRPILGGADEEELAPVLAALAIGPADIADLVATVERDPSLRTPEAARAVRAAMAALAKELALAFTPAPGARGDERLSRLAIWPVAGRPADELRAAVEVARAGELEEVLGALWSLGPGEPDQPHQSGESAPSPAGAVLDASAEDAAEALRGLVAFRSPVDLLVARIRAEARPGEPLAAQAPLLREAGRVARTIAVVHRHGGGADAVRALPLRVGVDGRLGGWEGRETFWASDDEIALVAGLGLRERLALPEWARATHEIDAELAPRLPPRRLLAELADPPAFAASAEQRARLYSWLIERRSEIEADAEACALLGRARVIVAADGELRAPRDLLLEPGLPDLGLGWGVGAAVPAPLVAWLRELYRLDETQLERLVEYLLDGCSRAAIDGDLVRHAELLRFLAGALGGRADDAEGGDELEALVRRLRVHKRLRVETTDGELVRCRGLLLPSAPRWLLIAAFLDPLPPRASPRYEDPAVRALLLAAGARADLDEETLLGALRRGQGVRTGANATVAIACYVAHRALEEPELRNGLALDRDPWVPDGRGELRRPSELYWPSPAVAAILGHRPELHPDPELVHTVPERLGTWLGFRHAADLDLADVAERFDGSEPAPDAILDWLDAGLRSGALAAKAVREHLADRPFLRDDDGVVRSPRELTRAGARELFGTRRRGSWSASRRFSALASALGVRDVPGRDEILAFLDEVGDDVRAVGPDAVMADEPELAMLVPRCTGHLAEGDDEVRCAVLPVVCVGADGAPALRLAGSPEVALPEPDELAPFAVEPEPGLRLAVLPEGGTDRAAELLHRHGVDGLASRWTQVRVVSPAPDSAGHEGALHELAAAANALGGLLDRVVPGARPLAPSRVELVATLEVEGRFAGRTVTMAATCALDSGDRLIVTPDALEERAEVAALLCREATRRAGGRRRVGARAVELATELLEIGDRAAMERRVPAVAREPAAVGAGATERGVPSRDETRPSPAASAPAELEASEPPRRGLLHRVVRWLGGGDDEPEPSRGDGADAGAQERAERPKVEAPRDRGHRGGRDARRERRERDREGRRGGRESADASPRGRGEGASVERSLRSGPQRPDQWFRPQHEVTSQLDAQLDPLEDRSRPPELGFAFAPARLPLPWLYGPKTLATRFRRDLQRWDALGVDRAWSCSPDETRGPGGSVGGPGRVDRIAFRGRAPDGEVVLPVPLYGRVEGFEAEPDARLVRASHGGFLVIARSPTDVRYRVVLEAPPRFDGDGLRPYAPPKQLLAATVPDRDLPDEVHDFLDELAARDLPMNERAIAIREMIRTRYRYDPTYLEDPEVARWLRNVTSGSANAHLAALHAGRSASHLGAGVCYELNVLAAEMLRRAGVAAGVATGWTFDRGAIAEPDHLWAMALLPTVDGPRWFPTDASTTRDGRPLHATERPTGPWRAKAPGGRRETRRREPKWVKEAEERASAPRPRRASGRASVSAGSGSASGPTRGGVRERARSSLPRSVSPPDVAVSPSHGASGGRGRRRKLPWADLVRVARYVEAVTGVPIDLEDQGSLRQRCAALLEDPARARKLLELLRDEA